MNFSDDEDEDYVPESLRDFLADASSKLDRDLEDVMNFEKYDTDYMDPCEPKDVPDPDAYEHETTSGDREEDKQFFEQILAKERDPKLKSELMAGIGYPSQDTKADGHTNNNNHSDMGPPSLVDESSSVDDFMSPSMSDLTSSTKNPAADLTASTAKRMAMEGMSSPQGVNLQAEFDKAQQEHQQQPQPQPDRLQPVAEGRVEEVASSSASPPQPPPTVASSWMAAIQSLPPSESLPTQTDLSLTYSSTTNATSNVLDGTRDASRNVTSAYQEQKPEAVTLMIVDEDNAEIYDKSEDVKATSTTDHPNKPTQSQSKQTVEVEEPATTPMELVAMTPPQQPSPSELRPADQPQQQQQQQPSLSDAVKVWGKAPDSPVRPIAPKSNVARASPPPPSHTTGTRVAGPPPPRMSASPPTIRPIPAEKGMTEAEDTTAMSIEQHPKVLAKIKPSPPRQRPSPPRQRPSPPRQRAPPPPPPPRPQSKNQSQKISPPQNAVANQRQRLQQQQPNPTKQRTASQPKSQQPTSVARSRPSGARGLKLVRKPPTPRFSPPRTRTRNKSPAPVAPSAPPPPTRREKKTRKAATPRFSSRERAPPRDRGTVQSNRPKPHIAPTPEKLNRSSTQKYVDRPRDITVVQQTPPKPPTPPTDSIPAIIHTSSDRNSSPPDVEAAFSNDSSVDVEKIINLVDLDELVGAGPSSSKQAKPGVPVDSRGRRELTTPEKISSRLLQGTSASLARTAKEPTSATNSLSGSIKRAKTSSPLPSRLLQGTESSLVHQALSPSKKTKTAESEREATKLRVRERVEEQKRKQAERDKAMRERIKMRQKQQKERVHKIQETLNRARGKRERLEQLERERVERIKQKIAEKDKKASQRMSEKENVSAKSTSTQTTQQSKRIRKATPTVPIAPSFATDRRMKRKPTSENSSGPPLARSSDILMQGLRASSPSPDIRRASSGSSGPTIPKGPRLSTSARHGEKHVALPIREANETPAWERGLRGNVSSPTPSERSSNYSLTIPKAPKFHETHKRERPKSTAEKDKEMIDYYKAHPFKARPVRMNDLSPAPRPTKVAAPRPLTRPAPFHFHSDDRIGKSREEPKGAKAENVMFKARPMPNFSSVRNTPLTGKSPPPTRPTTAPAPFHFHTDDRIGKSREEPENKKDENGIFKALPMPNFSSVRNTPLTGKVSPSKKLLTTPEPFKLRTDERASSVSPSKASKSTEGGTFRARPMPNFGKTSPVVIQRNPSRKTPPEEPKEKHQFKARSMPDFSKSGPPATISFNVTPSHDSTEDGLDDHSSQFHARPMPSFDKVSIPVVQRNPEKTRSPTHRAHQDEMQGRNGHEAEFKPFRARQVPDFSKPSIPVKPRSPSSKASSSGSRNGQRLVSPPRAKQSHARPQSPKFHARPVPKFSHPSIPVKQKDPSKLRSPDTVKKVGDTGMVIRAGRPLQHGGQSVSTAGSASGARSLTTDERAAIRVARKRQTKERVRERMMGNNKAMSTADAFKEDVKGILFEAKDAVKSEPIATGIRNSMESGVESNSTYEYSTSTSGAATAEMTRETVNRKARLSTLSSTEESTMENTDAVRSPVRPPAMSRVTEAPSASTGTETILQNWNLFNPSASTSEGTFGAPSTTTSGITGDSLRLATDLWPSPSNVMTPISGSARVRNPQLLRREQANVQEQEDEELKRYQEAVAYAYQIQKQADDELSFHGSISSKEQGNNIGQIESIL